jgi:hypothetical protein
MHRSLRLAPLFFALTLAGCEVSDGGDADASSVEDGGSRVPSAGSGSRAGSGSEGDASVPADAGEPSDASMSALDSGTEPPGTDPVGVPDPAPDRTLPGEYGCDGCPDADMSVFELDLGSVTSQSFEGIVTGAIGNGEFYLESAEGQSIGGAIPTSTSGTYLFTVPLFCGTQLLKCVWSNDSGSYVAVIEIVTADCLDADIRVTLTWDDLGFDYELHLVKEGGQINDNLTDCTWTSCIGSSPDWGVVGDDSDNPHKDVDNTGNFGPENIFYAMPEDGTYTVMIEHWGAGAAESDGQVTINLLDHAPVVIGITDLAAHHVFTAATIEWPSKTVTVVGSDYDCNANWSGGCRDMIP